MRVFVDTAILRRPATGTARWVRGLTTALAEEPDIELVTSMGPARIDWFRSGAGRPGARNWLMRVPNVMRQRWWYESGIRRAANRAGADVLLMPANLAARRGRLPQVVAILDVNFLTQPTTYERAAARYMAWSFRRSVRDADALITISEFSRDEICRHLGADPHGITVVYPGLPLPAPAAASSSLLDRPYALWVGATEVSKNVGLLLDAWSSGAPAGLSLAIVGPPGRDHPTLVERGSRLGGRVVIRGAVDDAELERWYRHAAIFLFPSRTEGFGFPPLEAMLRDVPVVAASAGSLPEVLGDAALFHDPDDAETLKAHIESVMRNETLRRDLVQRGRDRAARYRWDVTAAETAKVLRTTAAVGQSRQGQP
jgi:glycosyltransferase involved in cell wall biosynthesis